MSELRFNLPRVAKWSVVLTWLTVAATLVNAAHSYWLLDFVGRIKISSGDQQEIIAEAEKLDSMGQVISIAALICLIVAFVANAIWIYRASWNAGQLQPHETRISPGWAVGFFFVPIANLFKPFTAVKQIWNSSHDPYAFIDRPAPAFMAFWWFIWLVNGAIGNALFRMWLRAETADELRRAAVIDLITTPVSILGAVLFIKIVRAITTAQQGRVPAKLGINPTEGVSS